MLLQVLTQHLLCSTHKTHKCCFDCTTWIPSLLAVDTCLLSTQQLADNLELVPFATWQGKGFAGIVVNKASELLVPPVDDVHKIQAAAAQCWIAQQELPAFYNNFNTKNERR
jgi:hypothetical protein